MMVFFNPGDSMNFSKISQNMTTEQVSKKCMLQETQALKKQRATKKEQKHDKPICLCNSGASLSQHMIMKIEMDPNTDLKVDMQICSQAQKSYISF